MNKSPTVTLLAAMPFLAMVTMSWALIWLLYRAYLVLQIPNDVLVEKLGLDIPPAPELILEEITDRIIRVAWKVPDMHNSVQKHLVLLNGFKVCETKRSETSVVISRLRPSRIYHVSVITVSAANFHTTSPVLHVRTKPIDPSSSHPSDDDVASNANNVYAYVPHSASTHSGSPSVSPRDHSSGGGTSGGGGGGGGGTQASAKRSSSGKKSTLSTVASVGQVPAEYSSTSNHNHGVNENNNDATSGNTNNHNIISNNSYNINSTNHQFTGSENTGNDNASSDIGSTSAGAALDDSQRAGSEDELDPTKLEQLAGQLKALQQENDALETHILQEEKEHETISKELEEQRGELKARVKEKDEVNGDLRRQVSKLESVNRTVQGEKAKRHRIIQQRESERQKRKEDIARWQAQLAQIEKELPRLEEEKVKIRQKKEAKVSECQEKISGEQAEMKALDDEIQDKGGRMKAMEDERRRLQGDVSANHQEPERGEEEKEALWKAKVNHLHFQYDSLVSVFAQAQQQYHEAEEHLKWVRAQRSNFNLSAYPFSPMSSSAIDTDFSTSSSSPIINRNHARTRNHSFTGQHPRQPSPPINPVNPATTASFIDTAFSPGYSKSSNSPSFAHVPAFFNINNGTATPTTATAAPDALTPTSPTNLSVLDQEQPDQQQQPQQPQQSPQQQLKQQQQQQQQQQRQQQQQQQKGYSLHLSNGGESDDSSGSQPMSPHADSLLPSDLKVALDFVESAT